MQLKNRNIIVTGGCSGIGKALVTAYLAEGAKVVAFDVNDQAGQELAHEHDSDALRYIHCDIASDKSVSAAVISAVAFLGNLDVLVNCAGIAPGAPAELIDTAEWEQVFAVNALGTFLINREVFPHLKERGGRVINFASGAGVRGYPGKAHYAASKGAVLGWTRSIATEWAPYGITVNAVAPAISTPMYEKTRASMSAEQLALHDEDMARRIPIGGRLGDAESDLAPVLVFLAGEGSRFVTGQTLAVDGGLMMVS